MKKLSCLLAILLALTLLALPAFATEDEMTWTLSEDGETLDNGQTTYTLYTKGASLTFEPESLHLYDAIPHPDGNEYLVATSYHAEDVVLLTEDGFYSYPYLRYVYVTEAGKESLDKLLSQGYDRPLLFWSYDEYTELNPDVLADWDKGDFSFTIDVTELADYRCYEISGYDSALTFYHTHGALYEYMDALYYLNYDALDNSHFDADGNFSYRKGTVSLYPLPREDSDTLLLEKDEPSFFTGSHTSEKDATEEDGLTPAEARVVFTVLWTLTVLLPGGIIATVNLVRAKKSAAPTRNYLIAIPAALWTLVALLLLLLLFL